jgi:predicted MPP superfamily phosphohydrolase
MKIILQIRNLKEKSSVLVFSIILLLVLSTLGCNSAKENQNSTLIQFVYTSDSHFGITRPTFMGDTNVTSFMVNTAMIAKINALPKLVLPNDSGINAGKIVGGIDYLINTGDIANREVEGVQSATKSWKQFTEVYINGITLLNNKNLKTEMYLIPGNHDVTNAIGFYKKMDPPTDNASMVGIYNYMFPSSPKTSANYNYATDKIHYSKNISGIHFVFLNIWPDSSERIWLANDLKNINDTIPVLLFTHDEPNVEPKHFTNPNGKHDINAKDKFENLLPEIFKDGNKIKYPSIIEQRALVAFLKIHKNIKVYFHGNDNENRYYDYTGPDNDIALKTIQVDSPMKGNYSRKDETKLSFQLVTINTKLMELTVRECLWNSKKCTQNMPIVWGKSITISLR